MNVQTKASVERSITARSDQSRARPRVAITAMQLIVVFVYGTLALAVSTGYGAAFAPLVMQI